ncbi:MAG: hypothetical protein R2854_07450 [Caldilineaceae bacterium]
MAWVLFIIVLIFTLIQFKLSNRWVFYEGDGNNSYQWWIGGNFSFLFLDLRLSASNNK